MFAFLSCRLPPGKRPNYVKLGVTSPFFCCWDVLISEWSQRTSENADALCKAEKETPSSEFFVLRERTKLESLKAFVSILSTKNIENSSRNVPDFPDVVDLSASCKNRCLVPVTIYMCGRGSPTDCAMICLPSETDADNISKDIRSPGPTEEIHNDEHQLERKELRTEHKKLLKCLRRKRARERRKLEDLAAVNRDTSEDESHPKHVPVAGKRKANEPPPTKDPTDKHREILRSLWLPRTQTIKDSCSRTVIGFITKGDFCFTESQGAGQGYVVLSALLQLVALYRRRLREGSDVSAVWVLVRNPTSLQYRFAIITI
jgi:ribonuclease P/MRP protein subunit POP1